MHGSPLVKPNFIVIGPGKSGTTWIYNVLLRHEDVGLASAKETLYFEEHYWRGSKWYLDHFRNCEGREVVGEVSNTYIFSVQAAQRIFQFDPNMRIISCLRNPIDRTFSHYLFLRRNGYDGSFEKALSQTDIASRGMYHRYLSHYFNRFQRDQIAIFLFERMKNEPEEFVRRLFEFLGVDPRIDLRLDELDTFPSSMPRNKMIARVSKYLALKTRSIGRPDLVTKMKYSGLSSLLFRQYRDGEKPQMSDLQRERLAAFFAKDVKKLSGLLEVELSRYWSDFLV